MQFDIVDFYPSISPQLLTDSINFAAQHTDISDETIEIIMHARKSLLFDRNSTWIKNNETLFDVTMGSYDGAEICELVGIYLLSQMKSQLKSAQIGLYRDDGLGLLKKTSASQLERMKKAIVKLFHDNGLKITIETNLIQVNFLDVTLSLANGKFWPFAKENNQPLYIHKESNHPPTITKELPKMIESRITALSCNEDEFEKVKGTYNTSLKSSGFSDGIKYCKPTSKPTRTRNRNIIWFNPPYNAAVKTNIGKSFLALLDKHFPPHHKLAKIINRNNVKLSYSCSPSMASIISRHNKKILSMSLPSEQEPSSSNRSCNCRQREHCPLKGRCLEKTLIYKATIKAENSTTSYIGSTESTFKERYTSHKSSFQHEKQSSSTSHSSYIWELKKKKIPYELTWEIMKKASPYKCGTRRCDLCLTEKLLILKSDPQVTLNKHSEIMQKCRHSNKFKLKSIKA